MFFLLLHAKCKIIATSLAWRQGDRAGHSEWTETIWYTQVLSVPPMHSIHHPPWRLLIGGHRNRHTCKLIIVVVNSNNMKCNPLLRKLTNRFIACKSTSRITFLLDTVSRGISISIFGVQHGKRNYVHFFMIYVTVKTSCRTKLHVCSMHETKIKMRSHVEKIFWHHFFNCKETSCITHNTSILDRQIFTCNAKMTLPLQVPNASCSVPMFTALLCMWLVHRWIITSICLYGM